MEGCKKVYRIALFYFSKGKSFQLSRSCYICFSVGCHILSFCVFVLSRMQKNNSCYFNKQDKKTKSLLFHKCLMGYTLTGYGLFFAQQSNENFGAIARKHIDFYHIRIITNICACNFTITVKKTRLIFQQVWNR